MTELARAIAAIEGALAARPRKDDRLLAEAVEAICATRSALLRQAVRDRPALDTVNAVLSLVMAVQFPLGEVRWAELEAALAALASLPDGVPAASG